MKMLRLSAIHSRQLLLPACLFLLPALPAADETRALLQAMEPVPPAILEPAVTKALRVPLLTIVDKAKPSPTGDPHDYISYARYWWPDPAKPDGQPFLRRDGQHNREQVDAGDRKKIDHLVNSVTVLALGWAKLHREDCARRAGEWLRAWFITPATRMKPALDYAQVRLGHNKNLGNASGVLDTRTFAELVEALQLLEGSPALTTQDGAAIRQWFTEYFHWLETGPSALEEHKATNNHGTWFLVQAVALARYLGREDEARRLCEEDRARIGWQFAPDGRQPLELAREDGLGYSVFNLDAQLQLVQLARPLGVDLWNYAAPNGGSLQRGLAYLRPYNAAPQQWPHKQHAVLAPGFMNELLERAAALDRPRLTVVISIDQMRADYLARFRPYFGAGGFKRLLEGGADFQNCHYSHAITVTAPGHATILSGVNARVHGVIGNDWLDRATFLKGNAVEDAASPLVGLPPRVGRYPNAVLEAKSGRSPRNFLGTTVGDRLKARYGAAAKVFGVGDKDRSAILLSGPKADGAYWTEEGRFVTSTYYRAALPDWVEQFNATHGAWLQFGQVWDRLLGAAEYDKVQGPDDAPGEQPEDGLPVTFPKRIDGGKPAISGTFYDAYDHAPSDNDLVADMAVRLIEVEQLGQDGIPDLLCVGFSQTDKIGHAYGPDSHEVMDSYLRLDRTLAAFFDTLDRKVGLAHCVVVLTSDHGVSPLPERVLKEKGPGTAARIEGKEIVAYCKDALDAAFGPLPEGLYWSVLDGKGFHLNPAALQAKNLSASRVGAELKAILLHSPWVAAAYTREELTGPDPLDEFGEKMRLSYYAPRSPDVMFILRPNFLTRKQGTDHGTPYEYDSQVPLLWYGAGIKPAVHPERVAEEDLAPTLAALLGVELPPEAKGRRLF